MVRPQSSETYMRAVRPKPSPADLRSGSTASVSELSRFSYMKFLGVLWGLRLRHTEQELALASLSMLPSAITRGRTVEAFCGGSCLGRNRARRRRQPRRRHRVGVLRDRIHVS